MGKPRCALVILCNGKFGGEICCLSRVSHQMKPRRVKITAAEAVTKMRGDFGSDLRRLGVSRRNLRVFWWDGAGDPGHTLKVT